MNLAYYSRANNAYDNNNKKIYKSMEEKFHSECEELAMKLMIRRPNHQYELSDFLDSYLVKMKKKQITPRHALEKYVLEVAYGKGKMNAKFRTKYGARPEAKLARLEKIRAYMNNPNNHFNYDNINDPDYYDLSAANNYTNINWYTNSLNNRISKYRRLVNMSKMNKAARRIQTAVRTIQAKKAVTQQMSYLNNFRKLNQNDQRKILNLAFKI